MKVLMILEREFPPDDRVEKEAYSLLEAGHMVHIACFTMEGRPTHEIREGYHIFRKRMSGFIYKSGALILLLPLYFRFWRPFIRKLMEENQYDALHIHDLPLARLGFELKKRHPIKLILDQHEYYSDWINQTAHYNTLPGKIVRFLSNWKTYEKYYLSRADLVITVESPLKEIYRDVIGIPEEKIRSVPNTPRKSVFNFRNIRKDIIEKYDDRFVLLYIGGLDKLRGLDLAFRALQQLKEHLPNILLLLVGPPSKYFDISLKISQYQLQGYVEWVPFQPIEILPSYIVASHVCLFTPELNREEIHRTIATKIYQYVVMGKPVIVTRGRFMQQFVESNHLGYAVDDSDPKEFIRHVIRLADHPELLQQFRERALEVSEKYYWEVTVQPLVQYYDSLDRRMA